VNGVIGGGTLVFKFDESMPGLGDGRRETGGVTLCRLELDRAGRESQHVGFDAEASGILPTPVSDPRAPRT